ncbi:MAG TPA: CocE/NonD family hydrolase, partial [Pyrinomonadaceae bacterium]|nr:CocE/NonD family hydrolase [Pyrinomonadaceae bacterium]
MLLPKPLPAGEKVPAIMSMTRYWRWHQGDQPNTPFFTSHGFAQLLVDARGTGASFGVWRAPFSQDEIKDYGEVVNWI